MLEYEIYLCDVETTNLDLIDGDIIELSLLRFSTGEQKTWWLKPLNFEAIDLGSLRINGHKLEDITHKTAYGREKYREPSEVIVDIENWIAEDDISNEKRIFAAYNIVFDHPRVYMLWKKCNSSDSMPFGRRTIDPGSLEFFLDYIKDPNNMELGYSLKNVLKKYGIKNDKAHSAAADTKATGELLKAQMDKLRKVL